MNLESSIPVWLFLLCVAGLAMLLATSGAVFRRRRWWDRGPIQQTEFERLRNRVRR